MESINLFIEFTYDEYKGMCDADREQVYYALYSFFNNEALAYDMSQREVFDHVYAKTIEDESYEFTHILKDFEQFFGDDF